MIRRFPLEYRLPLFVSLLLVVLLCAGVGLAYREVRASATSSAVDRMSAAALQVVGMSNESWMQRTAALSELVAQPLFVPFARGDVRADDPEVGTLISGLRMPGESAVVVAVVRPDTVIQARIGTGFRGVPPPTWDDLVDWDGPIHVSEFVVRDDETFYWIAVPAVLPAGETAYVAWLRRLTGTSAQLFQDLVAEDASIFFAKLGSETWAEVGAPPIPAPSRIAAEGVRFDYVRDGERRIAVPHRITGTDVMLVAEQPYAAMLARANVFAWRFGVIGLVLIGSGVAVTLFFTRRALRPVTELSRASRDIARGNYERRVAINRQDELGELARAFNQMASDVERAISDAQYGQAAALRANRAKSVFLANMSHEIRTPINAIVGYAELLREGISGQLTPGQWRYVDRIMQTSTHLTRLVDEVLDTAKIESGELRITTESFPASWSVRSAVTVIAPQARARGIELTADCEEILFRGDPQRVEQILVNLLSNAVKFTDAGGKISVRGFSVEHGPGGLRHMCCFQVKDTGQGIPKDLQEHIFRPFVQLDEGYARTRSGAGLGLAISRQLARLMGGDITVESEPGVGSTFTVYLPAASNLAHHVEGERLNAFH